MRTRGRLALALALVATTSCGSSDKRGGGGPASGGGQGDVAPPAGGDETLEFKLIEGNIANHFFRRGAVAAHLLVSSGQKPRLVAAFPGGNSGIGLWFERQQAPVDFALVGALTAVERPDGLRGVRALVKSSAAQLRASGIVLSSVRVLRDYNSSPTLLPPEVKNLVDAGPPLVLRRTTVDGDHHFELIVEPQDGATASMGPGGSLVLAAAPGKGTFEVAFTFLHDDPPLTPIPLDELLTADAAPSENDRRALAFLVYREKMLAGSWRFLTYFGRDTLLSVRLLMPVLEPAAVEGALGSVIERLSATGEVAHEEDIGEFAALRNKKEGRPPTTTPIYDYKMVDDDFLLAPVVAHYLLDTEAGRARAAEFLARRTPSGATFAQAIEKNIQFVLQSAKPFSENRKARSLVALKKGLPVGDWRDSNDGLGGGRYSYNVNAVLVPAALAASSRLLQSKLLCPPADATCGELAENQGKIADVIGLAWRRARPLFEVELPAARARSLIAAYAREQGLDPTLALDALSKQGVKLSFPALSLDRNGRPVPVMHSDDSFALLFTEPEAAELEQIAARVSSPFPLGLRTPLGMVIANPAFVADRRLRGLFGRDRYHGAVMWSWQQAMMAAGLARQLERKDLPKEARMALVQAERDLWQVIRASDQFRTTELWSWKIEGGKFALYRLGEHEADTESNAAQLWSTVYLAVKPPAR
ncbi:MAG TPA: hypothetical protein VFU21_32450 [Kofleriaceae bacterium]|nr:hypothetical protein [Kofleriaceae bacterium]